MGRVYPPHSPTTFDPLLWISRFFDTVEVNASFYRIPAPRLSESWVERLRHDPRFRFSVKLHRSFTHDEPSLHPGRLDAFRDFLEPLIEDQRLGVLLAQFPWSFRNTPDHRDYLARLADALSPLPLAVELRHGGWADADGRIDLERIEAHPVSVDQPQVGDCIAPVLQDDGHFIYLRLHGRNRANWFSKKAGRNERYDYRYSLEELEPWTSALQPLASETRESYVITNNHFQGKAVVNALQLRALLGEKVTEFPRWLEEEFPEIRQELYRCGSTDAQGVVPVQEKTISRTRKNKRNDGQSDLFE